MRHGPFPGRLAAERIAAHAAATGGRQQVSGGVHGEHDIELHRPLVPGESLETWSRICAVRTSRAGTQVVMHIEQHDVAVEHWWTFVLLGLHGMPDLGSTPGDHRFPESARDKPIGSATQHIDEQVAHRYAEVSGDWSAHHFDIEVATKSGFDFVFAHGLCTMAMCTHRLLGLIGVDDPGRVRRVAVRFTSPTPLGADLRVDAFGIDDVSIAFQATCGGATTINHGRLELRS